MEGFHRGRLVVVVFMGLSAGIWDGTHRPILAMIALTIIIYDIYDNKE